MLNLSPRDEYRLALVTTERIEARAKRTKSVKDLRILSLLDARRRELLPLLKGTPS